MRAVVIAGGELGEPAFYRPLIQKEDLIICADSGYASARKIGILPDVVIGDFDSFEETQVHSGRKIVLPVEKDRTDSHEAICYAMDQGYCDILFLGAAGTRLDHTLANISLLQLGLSRGVRITMIDEHNEIFLMDREVTVPRREGYKLSLLPLTRVTGISSTGLYYELRDSEMEIGNPYGVSNEFTKDTATITIGSGLLLVLLSKD